MPQKANNYVALLQGINVGGSNKVSMADLKACFEKLGFENVQTYINSGNVIFSTSASDPHKLKQQIEKALDHDLSKSITVFIRSLAEIKKIVDAIPKNWIDASKKYDIIFLSDVIDNPKIIEEIQPKPEIEELHYLPGVLLWVISIKDFSKSNMMKVIGTKMRKEMTVRGPRTIRKIHELMKKTTL